MPHARLRTEHLQSPALAIARMATVLCCVVAGAAASQWLHVSGTPPAAATSLLAFSAAFCFPGAQFAATLEERRLVAAMPLMLGLALSATAFQSMTALQLSAELGVASAAIAAAFSGARLLVVAVSAAIGASLAPVFELAFLVAGIVPALCCGSYQNKGPGKGA